MVLDRLFYWLEKKRGVHFTLYREGNQIEVLVYLHLRCLLSTLNTRSKGIAKGSVLTFFGLLKGWTRNLPGKETGWGRI